MLSKRADYLVQIACGAIILSILYIGVEHLWLSKVRTINAYANALAQCQSKIPKAVP